MFTSEPVSTITRQRIFIIRGSVLAVKPSRIPVLGVAVMFGVRKLDISPFLNRHPAKFSIGPVCKFSTTVQLKEVSEKLDGRFFLQINLTKHLEIADIGPRVRSNVLRADLEAGKYIAEIF